LRCLPTAKKRGVNSDDLEKAKEVFRKYLQ